MKDLSANQPLFRESRSAAGPAFDEMIVAAASCGILVYDAAGQCRRANPAAARITGGTAPQLLQQNFRQLKSWAAAGLRRIAEEVLATGTPRSGEFHMETSFGRSFWFSCHFSRFEQNDAIHLLVILDDLANQKKAEANALRDAVIIESSDDAIISKTPGGEIVTWNSGAERMFGYTAREAVGRPVQMLIPPDLLDEEKEIQVKLRRGERVRQFETVRRRKDGSLISISATISPIINPAGELTGISTIARDITERKLLEAQFRQAQKMEAVGRLAGGVAHDFNNLLTIISGYCELLLHETPPGHPMRSHLGEIKKAGDRAAALTGQLLAFSRKQILMPNVVDLNVVVQDCEGLLQRLLGEDVVLQTQPATEPGQVKVDANQLEQALINLAINARDAMPQGGQLLIETAPVTLDQASLLEHPEVRPGQYVMLAVSDTGCGMDERTQSHIFEPFFTTKAPGQGTGLGLAMVFGFVKQSGGHISVQSEPGQGSTFRLFFPRMAAPEELAAVPPTEPGPPMGGCETILLVEDEDELRKLARQMLIRRGYTVLEAANGREALWLAEIYTGAIDLMISDVVMPVMGGRELAAQIAALRPGIKILFMSGYTDDAVMRHGVVSSATAFIRKPFTAETLPAKVRQVLTGDH